MRRSLLVACIATLVSLSAHAEITLCRGHTEASHGTGDPVEQRRVIEGEIENFQRLSEEVLSLRAQAIRTYLELRERLDNGGHLTGADLHTLNAGAVKLLAQSEALMQAAEAHECWAEPDREYPAIESGRRAGVTISLAAALLLYDNYLMAVAPFRNDHVMRQHFNRKDRGFELHAGTLNRMAANFVSPSHRQRVRHAIQWYEQHRGEPVSFEGEPYLRRLIEQSPSLAMIGKVAPLRDFANRLDFLSAFGVDALFSLKSEGTHLSSLLFGNAVGLVETRRGKLDQRPEISERVGARLRAGDILLEKTPFRLTDTFIPGHWGHAAVWVGNEKELRELGIWSHPVVRPYQASIQTGRGVVEALRSGVEMNNLAHFLNIDDLGVLRDEQMSDAARASVILEALRQVGKPYDFNFDTQTTHRVFCSKLVYLAYGDMQWPTSKMMGRITVSPDNIAARALGDGPLSVVLLYHDGTEIGARRKEVMETLMKAPAQARS